MTQNNEELEGFETHYSQHVKPLEESFEEKRIKALATRNKRAVISAIGFVLVSSIVVAIVMINKLKLPEEFEIPDLLYPILVIWALIYYWCYNPIKKYKQNIKQEIFPKIFSFFEKINYSSDVPVNMKDLKQRSGIIPKYHSCKMEDYISGDLDGVELKMFQAYLTKRESTGGNSTSSKKTVFKGIIISLSMNKNFSGKTVVKKDVGKIGNLFKGRDLSDLQRVKLESSEFEKDFEVYSSDQIEARYLLTPTFMERLLKFPELFSGNSTKIGIGILTHKLSHPCVVECSFYDDQVLITVSTDKDFFEVASVKQSVDFKNDANIIMEEIKQIEEIVEVLKLNQKTGI